MARYTDAVCKLCRREKQKLFLKGDRCFTEKCAVARRDYAPGQHGQRRRKLSEYGMQLREKQKARRFYGLLEGQFEKYYEMAVKQPGIAGENLLRILESRLDNVIYRLGFAMSRPEARQLVRHGHFTVDGKRVNIPSYLVREGQVIGIRQNSMSSPKLKAVLEANATMPIVGWLSVDKAHGQATIATLPTRDEIDYEVEENLIVELYSK